VDLCLWKESKSEDANKEAMKQCNWVKEWICIKEGKGIFVVKERERRYSWIYWRTIDEGVYQILEVTSNGTSVFCSKKEWEEAYGIKLQIFKWTDY